MAHQPSNSSTTTTTSSSSSSSSSTITTTTTTTNPTSTRTTATTKTTATFAPSPTSTTTTTTAHPSRAPTTTSTTSSSSPTLPHHQQQKQSPLPPPPQQQQQQPQLTQPVVSQPWSKPDIAPPPHPARDLQTTDTHRRRLSTQSTSPSRLNRTGSIFSLASLAREGVNALTNFSEPTLKNRTSSNNLPRTAVNPSPLSVSSTASHHKYGVSDVTTEIPPSRLPSRPSEAYLGQRQPLHETNPPSRPYSTTAADKPPHKVAHRPSYNKMHQTSSRLLRMTSDDRPFTRDFKDLFATLVVSLPLAPHRVRLTRIDHSFLSEEAINNLGSLKFSQSNRMPDPKDPSRIVTTTTTTTFSMAREMARSVCQRFLDARFIESADGKQAREFSMKGSVWQLTPKGIHVLERFCSKNGIQQKHVNDLVNSPKNTMQLVVLERDSTTDKLSSDRSTIEVIFRRFIGSNGPNIKSSTSSADSDSLSEYKDGIAGVKMANERKVGSPPRAVYQTFTGKAATDWLMDCCTTVERRETTEIASHFLDQELIWCVQPDRAYVAQVSQGDKEKEKDVRFHPTKHAIYQMTQKGKDVISMVNRERTSESDAAAGSAVSSRAGVSRDSNTQKLDKILNDAALRLLFRENLRDTHCEENLSFYLDVDEFLRACRLAIKMVTPRSGKGQIQGLDSIKETMASAYGIYNAFLAPGSPCELNIDHLLRNQLATRMTKAVGQDAAMIDSLREVTKLFEEAQLSVFKLMASDSVPKFMKSAKYEQTLKNYDFDSIAGSNQQPRMRTNLPERSMSRSNR
ncbi:developmental regulator flba [Phlyctema vagabunda]|uniref:Developmental regulator flba n=1 Tax=Phlyctema vagabunda TaxID=108571 RepID=A0ABR4P4L5_9HELO